jgi:hypothetical protein
MTEVSTLPAKESDKILKEIGEIIKQYVLISNIPLTSPYWSLQNAYRNALEVERLAIEALAKEREAKVSVPVSEPVKHPVPEIKKV